MPRSSSLYGRIARKEIEIFFSSPAAFIFLAIFLAINLFIFFWVEAFFARNIADVRPLFEWMPVLLIFLVSALTMRMWSEERRMGTLEFVMTVPIASIQFVLGKFLACLFLIALALALTLPIPITVSYLGNLDWGPVLGAYIATIALGAAYSAIGLFISARSDSQIVSLMMTVVLCFALYLLGADVLTNLVGNTGSEFLKSLGTGSRFESITRGVIDIRDLYYYLSIMGIFLALNVYALEKQRWATEKSTPRHGLWHSVTFLAVANFAIGNFWLSQVNTVRVDVTEGNIYTISDATESYLNRLQEPLLLRGYFSAKTHPLLAPLVPQMRDLLKEYEVAGDGKVRTEIIDPVLNPELEDEANNKYGIKPTPFQVADKYQAALVNSYFNILVKYGDQYEVLGFQELIDVKQEGETDIDVKLRNPEYDVTSAIKKVLTGYQSAGDLFSTIRSPVEFIGYVSEDDQLPDVLRDFKAQITSLLDDYKKEVGGGFSFRFIAPEANGGKVAQDLMENFGFRPMTTSILSNESFYFYLTLASGDELIQVSLPPDLNENEFKRNLEAGMKRFSNGFTKTVTLSLPEPKGQPQQFQPFGGKQSFQFLQEILDSELTVNTNDLSNSLVPEETDILMVMAPSELSETQLFAMDQYLMKGGTVILATSPFATELSPTSLTASKRDSGVQEWLKHMGVTIEQAMVLDTQNAAFPLPVTRRTRSGLSFTEIQLLDYPYFVDIRGEGILPDADFMAGIQQVTLNWASPLTLNAPEGVTAKPILASSTESWLTESTNIMPDFDGQSGPTYPEPSDQKSHVLAASLSGKFQSYFKDKDSPLYTAATADAESNEAEAEAEQKLGAVNSVIGHSAESARLIVFGSDAFVTDQTLQLVSTATRSLYRNSLQMMQNAVDWSLEDAALLSIRSRGHFTRTLPNLDRAEQQFFEWLNYGFVILSLIGLIAWHRARRANAHRYYQTVIS
jgi:ABC-2 type transport system permease protein